MTHDICCSCRRLVCGNTAGIAWVQNRCLRPHVLMSCTDFIIGLQIADNGKGIHFTSGRRQSQYGYDWQYTDNLRRIQNNIPRITVIADGSRYHLGAVYGTTAANRHYDFNTLFTAQLYTLTHCGNSRIWLHTGQLAPCDAILLENFNDIIVNTVALNTASAIYQQCLLAVSGYDIADMGNLPLTKINFCGN